MLSALCAEKYNDDQIGMVYEPAPFGEPKTIDNWLIVGPAGVGKTILVRSLALRLRGSDYFPIYVDLTQEGLPELKEELPAERPDSLLPYQSVYLRSGLSALGRAVARQALSGLIHQGLPLDSFRSELAGILHTTPEMVSLEAVAKEQFGLRESLEDGKPPLATCLGGESPGFSALCEAIAENLERSYGVKAVYFLDQLDAMSSSRTHPPDWGGRR